MTGPGKGTHFVCTLGVRSEKDISRVDTLGHTQSIQVLESPAKGRCRAPTLAERSLLGDLKILRRVTVKLSPLVETSR